MNPTLVDVLTRSADRRDCPPDIAAAILWVAGELSGHDQRKEPAPIALPVAPVADPTPILTKPDDAEEAIYGPTPRIGGRKPSIPYDTALKVYREWRSLGNIGLAAQRVGISYGAAYAIIRGRTYPEIAGRSRIVQNQPAEGTVVSRKFVSPETVAEILKAAETMKLTDIAEGLELPWATVQSIVNRRTKLARTVARNLGLETFGPNRRGRRGPNLSSEDIATIRNAAAGTPSSDLALRFGVGKATIDRHRRTKVMQ